MKKLQAEFYLRSDVEAVSRALLGKTLCTRVGRSVTCARIVETEAYGGVSDRASHAFGNRRTARTEVMFRPGGIAYVYLCYGLHALLNVITNAEGQPQAVLLRAVESLSGLEHMLKRRGLDAAGPGLTNGPGKLTEALGVNISFNGESLGGQRIWIEEAAPVPSRRIATGVRIGVDYAGEDAARPWRFWISDNPCVSRRASK